MTGRKKSMNSLKKSNKHKNIRKSSKRMQYSKDNLLRAVSEVKKGRTIAEQSRNFNIPESTIRAKLQNKYADKLPGPTTVFTQEEECEIKEWLFECGRSGFPLTKSDLIMTIKMICDQENKKTPFTQNMPGRSWWEGFLNRNPDVRSRVSENVCLRRAEVTEESLRNWFGITSSYLIENELLDIEPNRIFNSDETGLPMNPPPPKVLAEAGSRNVYRAVGNNEKENITVLITGNAAGQLAPTLVLFTGQKLPRNACAFAPNDFAFSYSDHGYMTGENFYEYIANIFDPWLTRMKINRPVILYLDQHVSHLSLRLSQLCAMRKIILIALHSNATHIDQPLDVAFFRPMKATWFKEVKKFCVENLIVGIAKHQFAPLVKKTLDSLDVIKILQNGFKRCGLYPFNADAIDYSRILRGKKKNSVETTDTDAPAQCNSSQENQLEVLEKIISLEKLESFNLNQTSEWKGLKEDESLFKLWFTLKYPHSTNSKELPEAKVECEEPELNDVLFEFDIEAEKEIDPLQYTPDELYNMEVVIAQSTNQERVNELVSHVSIHENSGKLVPVVISNLANESTHDIPTTNDISKESAAYSSNENNTLDISVNSLSNIAKKVESTNQERVHEFVSENSEKLVPVVISTTNDFSKESAACSSNQDTTLDVSVNSFSKIAKKVEVCDNIEIVKNRIVQESSSVIAFNIKKEYVESVVDNNKLEGECKMAICEKAICVELTHSSSLSPHITKDKNKKLDDLDESSRSLLNSSREDVLNTNPQTEMLSKKIKSETLSSLALQDITNVTTSKTGLSQHLPRRSIEMLKKNKSKKTKAKTNVLPVITSKEWQKLEEDKQKRKKETEDQKILNKKIKLEKAEKRKIDLEEKKRLKEEKAVRQVELNLQKEKEKLDKRQQRLLQIEEKKRQAESILNKRKEKDEIAKQIEDLKKKQEQLLA